MKTFRCKVCGDEYELMHICLKNPENNEIVCQKCGHLAEDHSDDIGCLFSCPNPNRFSATTCYCTKSKSDVIYEYHFSPPQKVDTCPDCGHDTKKHTRYGCVHKITLSNGNSGYCPCNKPQSEIPDKPEVQYKPAPKESGIKCPDCGCDVNLHSDVDKNNCPVMDYYGCNNYKRDAVCSCNLNFEDALNKAVEYAGMYSASAIALKANYEQNKKPEPQTCVICERIYKSSKDIETGIAIGAMGYIRFICETCHRKIIKCVAGRMGQ